MEQKRKTPWKLVLLISLALLPVGILAIAGRASDALSVPGAAAHQAAPAKAATNDLDFLSEMSKTNPAPEGIPWVRLIVGELAEFPEEDLVAPENAASRVDAGTRTANKLSFKTIVKSMIESCGSLAHLGSSQRPREQTSDLDSAGDQQ